MTTAVSTAVSTIERRDLTTIHGYDVNIDAELASVVSGRRKIGFIALAPGEYAVWAYEFDARSGNELPRYLGYAGTLDEAVALLAQTRRPDYLGGR